MQTDKPGKGFADIYGQRVEGGEDMLRGYVSEYLSCGNNSCTTSERFVGILDLRERNF